MPVLTRGCQALDTNGTKAASAERKSFQTHRCPLWFLFANVTVFNMGDLESAFRLYYTLDVLHQPPRFSVFNVTYVLLNTTHQQSCEGENEALASK